jgi:hypothetical protein
MNLNYKASNIMKAEEEHGVKFFDAIDKAGKDLATLWFLFSAGGASADEFDKEIEENGITGATLTFTQALANSGFLGKTMKAKAATPEFKKELEAQLEAEVSKEMAKLSKAALQDIGEEKKA